MDKELAELRSALVLEIDRMRDDHADEAILAMIDSVGFGSLAGYINDDAKKPVAPFDNWLRAARWKCPDKVVAHLISSVRGYLLDCAGLGKEQGMKEVGTQWRNEDFVHSTGPLSGATIGVQVPRDNPYVTTRG